MNRLLVVVIVVVVTVIIIPVVSGGTVDVCNHFSNSLEFQWVFVFLRNYPNVVIHNICMHGGKQHITIVIMWHRMPGSSSTTSLLILIAAVYVAG